uniref:Zgc:66479 n=1 Tax=Astyanax mexicanus TaxID=7994 RepID=W5LBD5_ASTMX
MARRRAKSSSKPDDPLLLLEPPVVQPRGIKEYALPCAVFIFILLAGSTLAWFCSQHQQAIEELTEALGTMQTRITKLQQQLGSGSAQLASVGGFEERLLGLEEAYAKAQRQAEVALAASEQIKSKDLQNKVWALQTEMNAKLAELQQNSISIASLNAILKNKSEEFEAVKQSVSAIMSANTELAVSVSGLASTLSLTETHLGEHVLVVEGLKSQVEDQKWEIAEMRESFTNKQEALVTNVQELMELRQQMELQQVKRAQAFKEQLKSLNKKLENHQSSPQSLHSQLADQLKAVQTQFLPGAQTEEVQDKVEEQAEKADDGEQVGTTDDKKKARKEEPEPTEPTEEKELTVQAEAKEEEKVTKEQGVQEDNKVIEKKGVAEEQDAEKEDNVSGEQEQEGNVSGEQDKKGRKRVKVKEQESEAEVEENVTKEEPRKEEEELNEKQGVTAGEEEHSAIPLEVNEEHQKERDAEKIQTSSDSEVSDLPSNQTEDTDLTQTEKDEQTEEVDTISEEALSLPEETKMNLNEIEETLAEEQVEEHAVAESSSLSNDVQAEKTETEDVDDAKEQDSKTAAEEDHAASDQTDSSRTNETEKEEGDSAQTEQVETEHEQEEELPEESAKE